MEEGLEHRGNVAAGRQIGLRHAVHQSLRRIVAHKADGQLARKELRRGRPHGQHVQQLAALHLAVLFDLCAQHRFRSALVALRREYKVSAELRPIDGPAGEHARHLRHVGLRVAAIHAQRMQFHQLARIILIQPGVGFLFRIGPPRRSDLRALGRRRIRPHAFGVIEVEHHGRTVRHGFKQILKLAQRPRPDYVALEAHQVIRHLLVLAQVHVEVIEPEIGHHFLELRVGVDVARQPLSKKLVRRGALRILEGSDRLFEIRVQARHQRLALRGLQRFHEAVELFRLHRLQTQHALLWRQGKNALDCCVVECRRCRSLIGVRRRRGRHGIHFGRRRHLTCSRLIHSCLIHSRLTRLHLVHVRLSWLLLASRLRVRRPAAAWLHVAFGIHALVHGAVRQAWRRVRRYRALVSLGLFARLDAVDLVLIHRLQCAALRDLDFAVRCKADDGVARQPEEQVLHAPLHGRELGQPRGQIGFVNRCGAQLLVEPLIEAHLPHGFKIPSSRPEGEAVQRVENALVAAQLARCGVRRVVRSGFGVGRRLAGICRRLRRADGSRYAKGVTEEDGR